METRRARSFQISTFPRLAAIALVAPLLIAGGSLAATKPAPSKSAPPKSAPGGKPAGHPLARPVGPIKFTAPEYVMGDPRAPVTVVEYLSNTCSHCAHLDADIWPKAKAKYVDTGRVKWVIREFITEPAPVSAAGFVLARCAGKDRYFQVIEGIFRAQDEMIKTNDWKGPFLRIARDAGLNEAQFNACLADDNAFKAAFARAQKAQDVDKIEGTPTLFINGKKTFEAVPSFGELDAALIAAGAG